VDQLRRLCRASDAHLLLLEERFIELLSYEEFGLPLHGYASLASDRRIEPEPPDGGELAFVQFSSGSTSDPKGSMLSMRAICAQEHMLWDRLEVGPHTQGVMWLPLSHDMGLIGMFLCSLAGAGDEWSRGGDLVLMSPRSFLRNPANWLAACETFGATLTAAPNYGYEMAARARGAVRDLSRLRVCIAGAEPIRTSSLERFTRAFRGSGFDPVAFCPAYGMAEAALAVTGTHPDVHWHATELDGALDGAPAQVVSSGTPLPGYEVRVDGAGVGEILVRGPSVASSYSDGTPLTDVDGWFHTRDLGIVRGGELYVLGRTDDVFYAAGRNIYAIDVEAYANEVNGVRDGRVVAVPEDGALTLVAECEPAFCDHVSANRLARELRQHIVSRLGVAPRRVLLASRGTLPITSSGKVRRRPLLAALQASQLPILAGSLE
jgi:acyl-CoA synthetase (AMP-forming)/AMP-acid ligase II